MLKERYEDLETTWMENTQLIKDAIRILEVRWKKMRKYDE
jgi:hypothetical protein